MENMYEHEKCAILYIDDEEKSLKYFARAFQNKFRILSAPNATEGYRILAEHRDEIGILITDQRMPGEKGVQFLEKARQLHPKAVRILTTAYSDLDVAIEAVNSGAIYKYVTKPWDIPELEITLRRASEFFMVQRERDFLLQEKLSTIHKMMITDRVLSLGIVAARLKDYVRNSLVAVRDFLDLAPDKLFADDLYIEKIRNPHFWKEFYGQAQNQMRRITEALTDLVVAATNSDTSVLYALKLDETIARSIQNLDETIFKKQIRVVNEISAGLPPLMVERKKFQRLFDLLLKLEVDNLPNGSHIFLSARTQGEDQDLELEIRDDGPGISREALRSVFDPFLLHTGQHQEFGVNLMACYLITYHHGGRIKIQNDEGKGVTFTLILPIRPKVISAAEEEEAFIAKVLMDDVFWERLVTGDD